MSNPRNAQRKIIALVRKLDAAYEALNDAGTDEDLNGAFAEMDEDPESLAGRPGMAERVDDAMEALIQVLNPAEKHLNTAGEKSAAGIKKMI